MDEPRLKTLMECTLSKSPAGVRIEGHHVPRLHASHSSDQMQKWRMALQCRRWSSGKTPRPCLTAGRPSRPSRPCVALLSQPATIWSVYRTGRLVIHALALRAGNNNTTHDFMTQQVLVCNVVFPIIILLCSQYPHWMHGAWVSGSHVAKETNIIALAACTS